MGDLEILKSLAEPQPAIDPTDLGTSVPKDSLPTIGTSAAEPTLEEQAELERRIQFVTKLATQGQEQTFISPTIPDAVEGILEIVREALSTGQIPNDRIRVKLYGTRGTKIVHLLSELDISARPGRYADYL
jgi:hypothetical protein